MCIYLLIYKYTFEILALKLCAREKPGKRTLLNSPSHQQTNSCLPESGLPLPAQPYEPPSFELGLLCEARYSVLTVSRSLSGQGDNTSFQQTAATIASLSLGPCLPFYRRLDTALKEVGPRIRTWDLCRLHGYVLGSTKYQNLCGCQSDSNPGPSDPESNALTVTTQYCTSSTPTIWLCRLYSTVFSSACHVQYMQYNTVRVGQ